MLSQSVMMPEEMTDNHKALFNTAVTTTNWKMCQMVRTLSKCDDFKIERLDFCYILHCNVNGTHHIQIVLFLDISEWTQTKMQR